MRMRSFQERAGVTVDQVDRSQVPSCARGRRSSRRVFSLARSRPMTGRMRWRWSGSSRIAPVAKRTRPRSRRRALKRGNPTRRPARRPFLARDQLCSAATRSAMPEA
jgi:hypothetical protein